MSEKARFPKSFWAANSIELFERAAYYAVASFVVIYLHEILGMSPTKATFLNGTILWGLIYFMPILSGTLADRFGFKKSLSLAFSLVVVGYFIMGTVQKFWPLILGESPELIDYTLPIVIGIVFIGIGGSFVKPCIAGTVQKTSGKFSTLGFGIFYMTINVGSVMGRIVSYFVRINFGIPSIFTYVATAFAFIGLLVILFIYKEPEYHETEEKKDIQKPKTLGQALLGMFIVLRNLKFVFFLIIIGFFWFIYVQIYNLIPLFLRYIDPNAAVELYTLVNPVMIVCFQLLITKLSKNWTPLKSIMLGIGVTVAGILLNVLPFVFGMNPFGKTSLLVLVLPVAGVFIALSIGSMAVGEMLTSPRIYQYIGAIAPKGQEGLYLGYSNLPIALGTIVGAPIGGILFEHFISHSTSETLPGNAIIMWSIVAFMGIISLIGVYIYDKYLIKEK
ncbi:MAG: MFS transporter [Acidobacteriota bacterium]|nr:MFS transporter [Acidobacteriota bacterium]